MPEAERSRRQLVPQASVGPSVRRSNTIGKVLLALSLFDAPVVVPASPEIEQNASARVQNASLPEKVRNMRSPLRRGGADTSRIGFSVPLRGVDYYFIRPVICQQNHATARVRPRNIDIARKHSHVGA
jgi:hypothetical protein